MSEKVNGERYLIFQILGYILTSVGVLIGILALVGFFWGIHFMIPIGIIISGVVFIILGFTLTKTRVIDLSGEIKKASQTFTTIHYKKLAKIIGSDPNLLLKRITDMVSSKELEATVEFPNIIFKKA